MIALPVDFSSATTAATAAAASFATATAVVLCYCYLPTTVLSCSSSIIYCSVTREGTYGLAIPISLLLLDVVVVIAVCVLRFVDESMSSIQYCMSLSLSSLLLLLLLSSCSIAVVFVSRLMKRPSLLRDTSFATATRRRCR